MNSGSLLHYPPLVKQPISRPPAEPCGQNFTLFSFVVAIFSQSYCHPLYRLEKGDPLGGECSLDEIDQLHMDHIPGSTPLARSPGEVGKGLTVTSPD